MTDRQPTATCLVFTLGPVADRGRRRLLPRELSAAELTLHQTGLEAALEAGRGADCRLAVFSPGDLDLPAGVVRRRQQGGSFGERFRNAFREAAIHEATCQEAPSGEANRGPVVAIGTDTPGLTSRHVEEALARLHRRPAEVVVGPATDGGFYLLAASGPLDEELAKVRWCGRRTLDTLLDALAAAGRAVSLLPPLEDLDSPRDLDLWLAGRRRGATAWQSLRRLLSQLLAAWRRPLVPTGPGTLVPHPIPVRAGRAPPAAG